MTKPLPHPNATTQPFWSGCQQGRFELQRCEACGHMQFPPRLACTSCHSGALGWVNASGRGTVYSFTTVYRAPIEAFKPDLPYIIAMIELEEGPRAMMNLRGADPERIAIGMEVEIFFEPPAADGGYPLPQARLRS
ncbi:Zn-ribbon domain-containing OB-fold protein [Acidocella sp.]|uniref:Zn-ribbon domain-containing OB-fold protein n=1 Tax=Acidocella sp. TaxID=50710 RepID=UPI002612F24C|nr:Zn-ribbon domain-containing OB-fold protein [Acidocella sp.]